MKLFLLKLKFWLWISPRQRLINRLRRFLGIDADVYILAGHVTEHRRLIAGVRLDAEAAIAAGARRTEEVGAQAELTRRRVQYYGEHVDTLKTTCRRFNAILIAEERDKT